MAQTSSFASNRYTDDESKEFCEKSTISRTFCEWTKRLVKEKASREMATKNYIKAGDKERKARTLKENLSCLLHSKSLQDT